MTLKETITQARIQALREKDNLTKTSVGYILAAIKQKEVDTKKEVTDADILAIIKTLIRQRRDTIENEKYKDIKELVEKDTAEIAILSRFLPVQLTEYEVLTVIREAIIEVKAHKEKVILGDIMPLVKPKLVGKTDMQKVRELIEKELV